MGRAFQSFSMKCRIDTSYCSAIVVIDVVEWECKPCFVGNRIDITK
jgi:hypothetical protein